MKNNAAPKENGSSGVPASTGRSSDGKEGGAAAVPGRSDGKESAVSGRLAGRVKEIYELMLEEGLTEFELKEKGFTLYLRRRGAASPAPDSCQPPPSRRPAAPSSAPAAKSAEPEGRKIISPINGVFYRASSPKTPAFASEGDEIAAGRTLCIIEAMKVMNEIKADARMKILKILVENGKTVNQGQPIFIVE